MLLPENIELVNQVDDSTCCHATTAMVTGCTIGSLIERFGTGGDPEKEDDGMSDRDFVKVLMEHMILPVPVHGFLIHPFPQYGVFKVAAPSINRPGRLHSLVITSHPKEGYKVFDPQNGREGKKWYPFDAMQSGTKGPRVSYTSILQLVDMSI